MSKEKKLFIIFLVLTIAVNIFIIVECCLPAATSEGQSDWVSGIIGSFINVKNSKEFAMAVRKLLGHLGIFLINGIFASFTVYFFAIIKDKKKLSFCIMVSLSFGFLMALISELVQLPVPGRFFAITDVLIDFGGYLVGALIVLLILFRKKKEKAPDDASSK